MTFTIALGYWLIPVAITLALFLGWRLFGVRMQPQNGSMFPDVAGGLLEVGGYAVVVLLSIIVWLIYFIIR